MLAGQGNNPLLFDAEGLRALASDPIVRRGIAYFNEHRVTELFWDERSVSAVVEGSSVYDVSVGLDVDGELVVECSCPFDWEPACKHAIATLLAYADRVAVPDEKVRTAADEALEDRRKRAKRQVVVEHVAGDPTFGTWKARSITRGGESLRSYRVELRSVRERLNYCTCPDFATNRLGTCKHIEAVIHRLEKDGVAVAGPPRVTVVYLAWDVAEAPKIRARRGAALSVETAALLDAHFDAAGIMRGSLPTAFFRFAAEVEGREDVHVSEGAREHAAWLAEQTARAVRGGRIAAQIRSSGGQLAGVDARLYPYQVEGVAFLASNGRALLADDMGLGKTLQAIAASRVLIDADGVRRILVVCPASLKHQWAREIARFTGLDTQIVQGPAATRLAQYRRHATFTIVNYEIVLRDADVIQRDLAADLLVLDEAQRIKNWRTKTAAAIKSLQTRYAFVLSGTPLENRLEDLYSVMQVVDQRLLGPLWQFMLEFHVLDHRDKVLGHRNLSVLRQRLAPVMLRRDRSLVRGQLPDRIEHRLDVPLSGKQRELHDSAMTGVSKYARIAQKRPLTPPEETKLLSLLQQARMACDAAGLVDGETVGSPKLDELRSLLEELCVDGGRKVVVFSQWKRMTAMAGAVAEELGLGTISLSGDVPTSRRGELIDRFRDDPTVQVFLSTDAGGVGLNLQAATALVNLDVPWNPAVLDQRIARVHRLGQRESVDIFLLVATESYEEQVLGLVSTKRDLFLNTVADGDEEAVGLTKGAIAATLKALQEPDQPGVSGDEETTRAATDPVPAPDDSPESDSRPDRPVDPRIDAVVVAVQKALGEVLERLLVSGTGLLAVTTGPPPPLSLPAELTDGIDVAVVDGATWRALKQFSAGALVSAAATVFEREEAASVGSGKPDPMQARARRKLEAGEVLLERGVAGEATALFAAAMQAAAAARAGRLDPLDEATLAVWLYQEAVPSGALSAEQAAALLRAQAVSAAPDVPEALARDIQRDARALVLGAG